MPALVPFDTLPELFTGLVDHYRGREVTALRYKDTDRETWVGITWEELNRRVEALAGYLHSRGVRPGDRVAILSENRPEWVIIDLAAQVLGGVNVSLYTTLPADQVAYILRDSGSQIFFTSTTIQQRKAEEIFESCPDLSEVVTMTDPGSDPASYVRTWTEVTAEGRSYWDEHRGKLSSIRDEVGPDDLASLIYTSGTTGQPKGVMLTHENFCSNVKSALSVVPFDDRDHHLSFLPLCHSFERTAGYFAVMACGATISYAESINAVSRNLQEESPTVMISVPRLFEKTYNMVNRKMEEGSVARKILFDWAVRVGRRFARKKIAGDTPGPLLRAQNRIARRLVFSKLHERLGGNLDFAVSGGAALSREIAEFFLAAGIPVVEGYGLTETAPILTANPIDRPRPGAVGHVIPGVTVAIRDLETGDLVGRLGGDDYPSELDTPEGEILVKGPNVMEGYWNDEEATEAAFDEDGWFHTGDVGQFEDGYLTITDRVKHMLVSAGGKNVYPGPIEDEFKTVRWIDQIMVVGEGREFLAALVVPDFDELTAFAREEGILYGDPADLLEKEAVQELFEREFKKYSKKASGHEKIRRFRLLDEPFTVENGLLTPTLKLRRREIEREYGDVIDQMYAEVMSRSR